MQLNRNAFLCFPLISDSERETEKKKRRRLSFSLPILETKLARLIIDQGTAFHLCSLSPCLVSNNTPIRVHPRVSSLKVRRCSHNKHTVPPLISRIFKRFKSIFFSQSIQSNHRMNDFITPSSSRSETWRKEEDERLSPATSLNENGKHSWTNVQQMKTIQAHRITFVRSILFLETQKKRKEKKRKEKNINTITSSTSFDSTSWGDFQVIEACRESNACLFENNWRIIADVT